MTPRTAITARWARRAIVAALSGAVVLLLGEAALRLAVFSDISLLQPLRRPERYADWFADDDYWKLQHLFGSRFPAPSNPHPELGWIGRFRREDYVHFDAGQLDGRRPVLLYGDSFAACVPQSESFQ